MRSQTTGKGRVLLDAVQHALCQDPSLLQTKRLGSYAEPLDVSVPLIAEASAVLGERSKEHTRNLEALDNGTPADYARSRQRNDGDHGGLGNQAERVA